MRGRSPTHTLVRTRTGASSRTSTLLFLLLLLSLLGGGLHTASAKPTDDCPGVDGDSQHDRTGCPDSDGDGWSDPDGNWTVDDGADAFVKEVTQWADSDGDGFGDNQDPDAELIDHFPANNGLHRALISVGCNPPDHTIVRSDSKTAHFDCTVRNEVGHTVRIYVGWDTIPGITISEKPTVLYLSAKGSGGDVAEIRLSFKGTESGLSGGDLVLTESSDPQPLYSIGLPVLIEEPALKPSTSTNRPSVDLSPVESAVGDFAGWASAETGRNVTVQQAAAILLLVPLLLLVAGRRTHVVVQRKRSEKSALMEEEANEEERERREAEEKEQPNEKSIEEMAAVDDATPTGPKRGVKGAEGKVLEDGMFDVIVGEFDMPDDPGDSFNVRSEMIDDSEIAGELWSEESDEEQDDDESTVAGKHRAKKRSDERIEDDVDDSPGPKPTKKSGKKSKKTTAKKPKSKQADAEHASEKPKPKKKRKQGGKKRPKGKVGHTRGPGIDL
ncbi:MAG: hypothetical protein CXX71_02440 [Methanobacteriota archaeon]|nr:MAG: hypothetical protein CXX71_02440 [Euryarchaeota archaeon]